MAMQVSVETLSGLERKMTIEVPQDTVEKAVAEKIQEYSKHARIDGFRQGKVPRQVIEQQYGEAVLQEVLAKITETSLQDAFKEKELNPVAMPEVEFTKTERNAPFEYIAKFEVAPEVTLPDFAGIAIDKVSGELDATDMDEMLQRLQKQHIKWEKVDRAAKNDDRVTLDFKGSIDGQEQADASAQGFQLELGSGSMIPGFEDGVVGLKEGGEKTIKLTFPKDYQKPDYADKPAEFQVTINLVEESKLPELNDEFAALFDINDGLDKLKEKLRGTMLREMERSVDAQNRQQVFDKMLEMTTVELPKSMVRSEIDALKKQAINYFFKGQETKFDASQLPDDEFVKKAERRISLGYVVSEFIKQNKIEANADQVRDLIEKMASAYDDPERFKAWYYSDDEKYAEIEALAMEQKVVETITTSAKVTEKKLNYREIMQRNEEA